MPAHTYCASAIPFARNGAKLVWADINFDTRTIDLEDFKKKLQKKQELLLLYIYMDMLLILEI